jgi:hypothetical protein
MTPAACVSRGHARCTAGAHLTQELDMRVSTWTRVFALCALAMGLLEATPADAASLAVNGWTLGEQVNVQSAVRSGWVNTAELDVTIDGQRGFSYCVDLGQNIGIGGSAGWTMTDPDLSAGVMRAAWLVEFAKPQFETLGASRATVIAALQVSIWEVLSETPGAYNLYAGAFALSSGGASTGVMNLARGFLGAVGSADLQAFQTSAVWARHGTRQDQLVFTPIPEPGSIALFAAGIALVAFAGRRKVA